MKKISMSLSSSSVDAAIMELKAYRLKLRTAIDRAIEKLMDAAADHLRTEIGFKDALDSISWLPEDPEDKSIDVSSVRTDNGFILTMTGNGAGFIEFGTGAYVDEQHLFRERAPFPVFSGSYSDTVGAGTWNAWIKAGKDPEQYPFNREPTRPLYETSVWIRENWARYLREEIKKI